MASDRQRYSETVKRAARRLVADDGLTHEQAVRRLRADHGVIVPRSTLGQWLRVRPSALELPEDLSSEAREQARRILRLTRLEIQALERQRSTRDLSRLERLARILRSIEGRPDLKGDPNPNGKRPRTLEDLGNEQGEA
jgi:transposase-like protein